MDESPYQGPLRTALVLDDEVQIGAVVCKVLTTLGIAAKQFIDPLQFLLEVKREAPDLVLLDLALGRSDAVDVIRQLDTLKFGGRVLLVSGRDEMTLREIERVGRSHGLIMMPSMQKPFRAADLRSRLQAVEPSAAADPEEEQQAPQADPANAKVLLELALQRDWLEVWYQPKVELKSLSVCGAEALVRARVPDRGFLGPAELLPAAGDPLYKPLTLFIIRRVVTDWLRFAAEGRSMRLAVNVPVSVLAAAGFVDFVRKTLPTDPSFSGLIIEVTEGEAIRDIDWMHEVAAQLRLYNVWLSIDDFGSGYASLSRVKDLPFREIKLDRSFVTGCATDNLKRGLCQTVVELAHCVGATACAEGVESTADLRSLMALGFDTAQGFVFAKPMPPEQFLEFIAKPQAGPTERAQPVAASSAAPSA